MTRSITFIDTLIERAISSEVAVTLAGESANAVAVPQTSSKPARVQVVTDRSVSQHVGGRRRRRHHLLALVDQRVEIALQRFAALARAEDRLHRIDVRAVPVCIEDRRELRHDGADDERVHVDEVVGQAAHEILVGDVTSSRNGHRAIGDEQLVVHPMVEAAEIGERVDVLVEQAVAAAAERVEQPDLDVRKRREPDEQRITAGRVEVVDDEPHPNTAPRRIAQVAQQQTARLVVLDEVVLDVERLGGPLRQRHARVERIDAERHQPEPGELRFGERGLRDPRERALRRRLERDRGRALDIGGQGPAARCKHCRAEYDDTSMRQPR